ncbi:MAG TPA: flavodoxin family protein [Dongiaceae bacterium]|jgi:multimeric flavodoxin WrbA|nr:flavodoxin family protein [Dongiaceae bacterium]
MPSIAVVYHSGYGHTKVQAEAVARGAATVADAKVTLVPVAEAEEKGAMLDEADAIIFGAPTYMGSISGPFKVFMDGTSKRWLEGKWRNKIAAGFTNSGSQSGDKLVSLFQLVTLAMQHGMIWVGLDIMAGNNSSKGSLDDLNRLGAWVGAMAQSNIDQGPEAGPIPSDLRTAEALGRRVAEQAKIRKKP